MFAKTFDFSQYVKSYYSGIFKLGNVQRNVFFSLDIDFFLKMQQIWVKKNQIWKTIFSRNRWIFLRNFSSVVSSAEGDDASIMQHSIICFEKYFSTMSMTLTNPTNTKGWVQKWFPVNGCCDFFIYAFQN